MKFSCILVSEINQIVEVSCERGEHFKHMY